jgi:molybdate transport system ATP-binding protein
MLEASFSKRVGAFRLEIELTAGPGTLVLAGESGAGKTTILNVLAGLADPDHGTIRVNGDTYFASERGVRVPPEARSVGYVFQDYALFPHLSIFENVAFGLRAQRLPRDVVARRVRAALRRTGVEDLAPRRPGTVSGGQQQRVALARALALEPQLLLLDEPLSALDLRTQSAVRGELRELLRALPCITLIVTHHPVDALALGDAIAVVEDGRISQRGARDELLRRPRSRYVADLMGLNFFQGRAVGEEAPGLAVVQTDDGVLRVVGPRPGESVFVAVDPKDITLHLAPPAGTAQNLFAGTIAQLVPEPPFGERVRVTLRTRPPLVAEVTARAVERLGLREGAAVHAAFKATAPAVYR